MNNKDILNHIKSVLKEFEMLHHKIQNKEDYDSFLKYLVTLSTILDKKEGNPYGIGIAEQINNIKDRKKILYNLSNLKNNL